MKKLIRYIAAAAALAAALAGCGGHPLKAGEVALSSDYDGLRLSDYIECAEYIGVEYVPFGDPGRTTADYGDTLTVSSSFYVEGEKEPRELISSFVLGDSGLPDAYDDALYGARPGDPVNGHVDFPADDSRYGELSGKSADFSAEIMILDLSYYRDLNAGAVLNDVVAASTVLKWPEDIVAMYAEDFEENYRAFAASYDMELDSYLSSFFGFGEELLNERCRSDAENAVKEDLVIYRIWELEQMKLSEADLENCRQLWLQTYGYASEEDMPVGWDDEGVRRSLISMAVQRKVKDFLLENAKAKSIP